MLLKYHPELQFRLQSYKHLRTYIALFPYKRKLVASIHVNKIICILICFQDQTFSLQFLVYSGATQACLELLLCATDTDAGPQVSLGTLWHSRFGTLLYVQTVPARTAPKNAPLEPQANALGSPDTVQVMQRSCSFYFRPIAEHERGRWIPKLQWEGWRERCYQTYQKRKASGYSNEGRAYGDGQRFFVPPVIMSVMVSWAALLL